MGTTLTGTTPQDTYDSLIKVTDNGPLSATAKFLSDGLGNDSVLAMSTARVGIGTATPTHLLQVFAASAPELRLGDATTTIQMYTAGAEAVLGTVSSHPFVFRTNTAERMRITAAGNVGIGTSTPSTSLEVVKNDAVTNDSTNALDITHTSSGTTANGFGVGLGFFIENSTYSTLNEVGRIEVVETDQTTLNDAMVFYTKTNNVLTEKIRIIPSGGITFNGDTAAANALDDYEEGTWTIGIAFGGAATGVTYSQNLGAYTKIGRKVTVTGFLQLSNKGSSSGAAKITGLPFTNAATLANLSAATLWINNITFANQFQAYVDQNNTNIDIFEITVLGSLTTITNADFANNSEIMISATYFV
jgi:hypothetical protein